MAALIALDLTVERANRACDLDFHARQQVPRREISSDNDNYQVTMLEGREKCEMKLTKPLKFKTGRRDCKTEEDRKFVTKDHEVGITILKEA